MLSKYLPSMPTFRLENLARASRNHLSHQRSRSGARRAWQLKINWPLQRVACSGLLDEAATRRSRGGNRAPEFTTFASPLLTRGRVLIDRCEVPEERCLQFDKAAYLKSGHNRCVNAKNGSRLLQRYRPNPWRSTVFPAKRCIRYFSK